MKFKMKSLVAAGAVWLLSLCMIAPLVAVDPVLEVPLSYEGYVFLDYGPEFSGTGLELYVKRGGTFVPGLTVKLEDRTATYEHESYLCRYKGLCPAPGGTVNVSIARRGIFPGVRPDELRVTGTVPSLLDFSAPRDRAVVSVAGGRTLEVTWSGDSPPYTFAIRALGARTSLVKAEGIVGTRYSVPMATFTPGTQYRLIVTGSEHKMRFSAPVSVGSTFKLAQFRSIIITVE